MTVEQLYVGLTSLVDMSLAILNSTSSTVLHQTTSDRTKLTTTIEAAAELTAIHGNVGFVHEAVDDVAATEGITSQLDSVRSLVVQFWYVFIVGNCRF